jgi:hypothetical protein
VVRAFPGEDGLEEDVLPAQLRDVVVDALALLEGGLVDGQFLVVLEGVELVGEQLELLRPVQEALLGVLQLLQQLERPLRNHPHHRRVPDLALPALDLLLSKRLGLHRYLVVDLQPAPGWLLQLFPLRLALLLAVGGLLGVVVGVDEVEAAKEVAGRGLGVVGDDELDQVRPYFEVAVLLGVDSPLGSVDLVGEGDHLVEGAHQVGGVVPVRAEGEGEVVLEEEVVVVTVPVVDLPHQRADALAGSAHTALRVLQHQLAQDFSLHRVDLHHQFLPQFLLESAQRAHEFLDVEQHVATGVGLGLDLGESALAEMPEAARGDDVVGLHEPLGDLGHRGLVQRADLSASFAAEGDVDAFVARVEVLVADDGWLVVVYPQ